MRRIALIVAAFLLLTPTFAFADGWSFKNLWPSAGKSESNARTHDQKTSLLNGRPLINSPYKGRSATHNDGPSVFGRIGAGTKTFFSKTTDMLTFSFLRKEPEEQTVSSFPSWKQDSSNAGSRWSNKKDKGEKKPGWFAVMFQRSEPSHPSRTMSDFFKQDRPESKDLR